MEHSVQVKNKTVGPGQPCYLIAEIGNNHQGSRDEALKLIKKAHDCGFDAVKFQKRNNLTLFHKDYYNSTYNGENSFGTTYGEHREFLEPKIEWLKECNNLAHSLDLHFIMTVFDIESLELCETHLKIDAYKIQSADLTNLPLLKAVAQTGKPYFMSCGASSVGEIRETVNFCRTQKSLFVLMYAISSYPTKAEDLNLGRISFLKEDLQTTLIGYSCHYVTNEASLAARLLGASAIERHFTLDKTQKGADHKFSALPEEIEVLVSDLAKIDKMLGKTYPSQHQVSVYEKDARYKMGKSAIASRAIESGMILSEQDIIYKSPMSGLNPLEIQRYFNTPVKINIAEGEVLTSGHFD